MDKVEAKFKELEEELSQVKIQMKVKDRGLEEEKKAIVDYMEKEFATKIWHKRDCRMRQSIIFLSKVQNSNKCMEQL